VSNSLDLYARVEDLLGVKEVAPKLYAHYFLALNGIEFDSLLDVGCGSGDFLYQIDRAFSPSKVVGIDLSPQMIAQSKIHKLDTRVQNLCEVEESFDVITAVFDMINYLDRDTLKSFLDCLSSRLNSGGYLLCDINTLFGFQEVAVGSISIDDNDRFLAIESEFDNGVYSSEFTLFSREGECYSKSKESINQYYYTTDEIAQALPSMRLIQEDGVALYFEQEDKLFLVFEKV